MSVLETNGLTILDYLNEDCWREVLDYVSTRDVILSERVSHGWQRMVQAYLRRVLICIEHPRYLVGERHKACKLTLKVDQCSSFDSWTNKLGPSVVSTYCASEENLRTIGENCPNLDTIKYFGLNGRLLLTNQHENFRWLQRICFYICPFVSDRCVNRLTAHNVLEELEFHNNDQVTGEFLMKINFKNLKSLVFNRCEALEFRHLWSSVSRLSQLTKLELKLAPLEVYRKLHLLLNRMHKLEHLELSHPTFSVVSFAKLFESVCRLRSLKHLGGGIVTTDRDLKVVVERCKALRSLDLTDCTELTGRGLVTACAQAGARLSALGVHRAGITDDDVLACVRVCPNLESLDVRLCSKLTLGFLERASRARRERGAGGARGGGGGGGAAARGRGGELRVHVDNRSPVLFGQANNLSMGKYEGLVIHH